MLGRGDSGDVARIPAVGGGIVAAQEAASGFRHAEQAGDRHPSGRVAGGTAGRITPVARYEAAIDQHGEAPVGGERGQHPEPAAKVGDGLHQLVEVELGGEQRADAVQDGEALGLLAHPFGEERVLEGHAAELRELQSDGLVGVV